MGKLSIVLTILGLVVGVFVGYKLSEGKKDSSTADIEPSSGYPLLSRRIFMENPNDIVINFMDLRQKLRDYVEAKKEKIGIYFEYLPNGTSIGINEKEDFFRASLVKVPVVMRAYKLIEEGKLKKEDELLVERQHIDPTYGELWKKGVGAGINVKDAIRLILTKSDNTAYEVLNAKVGSEILQEELGEERAVTNVYDYLDIPRREVGVNQYITPKNFSSILKSLYFSAYLSYESSNEILDLMTRSEYKDGIVQGIPEDIKVAHKFGIYTLSEEEFKVHSDCAIVYLPRRNYILCVMLSVSEDDAKGIFRELTKIVFEYVNSINSK